MYSIENAERLNKNKAYYCNGCKHLHIGKRVDRNFCIALGASDSMQLRVNGIVHDPMERCIMKNTDYMFVGWPGANGIVQCFREN